MKTVAKKVSENPLTSVSHQNGVTGSKPMFKKSAPKAPYIYFTAKAWEQMYTIIPMATSMNTEVTWFAPLVREEYSDGSVSITIPEIFIPDQEVASTTCDECSWAKPLEEAYEKGYDLNDMRGWFHLHPMKSVEPSNTDEEQTQDFIDGGWDTLMRGIFNKDGDYKLDYFDANSGDNGTIFHDLHINILHPQDYELDKMAKDFRERVKRKKYVAPKTFRQNNFNKKKTKNLPAVVQDDLDGIDYFDDDSALKTKSVNNISVGTIGNIEAYVDYDEVDVFSEESDLRYYDGTSLGITLIQGLINEDIDVESVCSLVQECNVSDDELEKCWPRFVKIFKKYYEENKTVVNQ